MCFRPRRRLQLFHEMLDHLLRDGLNPALILLKDHRERRFKIDYFDPRTIVGEEINPTLPSLPHDVRAIEGEVTLGTQMLSTAFARRLYRRDTSQEGEAPCSWFDIFSVPGA